MLKFRFAVSVAALLVAGAALAQDTPAFDPEACAKNCREMAAAHQKAMDARKAQMEKRQAAWKDIEAQLDAAKKARGDKKVAALEAAIEKLVAFHASAPGPMGDHPMMGGAMRGPGQGRMAGGGMGMGCCGAGMMGCCGGGGMGPGPGPHDCPMMKGMAGPPEAPKPEN
jgi:hypothetical protein